MGDKEVCYFCNVYLCKVIKICNVYLCRYNWSFWLLGLETLPRRYSRFTFVLSFVSRCTPKREFYGSFISHKFLFLVRQKKFWEDFFLRQFILKYLQFTIIFIPTLGFQLDLPSGYLDSETYSWKCITGRFVIQWISHLWYKLRGKTKSERIWYFRGPEF